MAVALGSRARMHPSMPVYHLHEHNRCPGCGDGQWWVGRVAAECAVCGTALPLADYRRSPAFALSRAA